MRGQSLGAPLPSPPPPPPAPPGSRVFLFSEAQGPGASGRPGWDEYLMAEALSKMEKWIWARSWGVGQSGGSTPGPASPSRWSLLQEPRRPQARPQEGGLRLTAGQCVDPTLLWNLPLPPASALPHPCSPLPGPADPQGRGEGGLTGPGCRTLRAIPSQQALLLGGARTRGCLVTHPLRMAHSVPAALPADSLSAALALPSAHRPSQGLCAGPGAAGGARGHWLGSGLGARPREPGVGPGCPCRTGTRGGRGGAGEGSP